jgi:purine nucleosidase
VLQASRIKEEMRYVVIDTDPGVDDAIALLLASDLERLGHIKVVGYTSVFGNVGVDITTRNLSYIVEHFTATQGVCIYRGAHQALLELPRVAVEFHGSNGLGDVQLPLVSMQNVHPSMNAAMALLELSKAYSNLELIILGPCTNVALACRLDHQFASRVAKVTIMGGTVRAQGNTTLTGEFNFACDPEAAEIVLGAFKDITLVPWELTLDLALAMEWYNVWVSADNPRAKFIEAIMRVPHEKYAPTFPNFVVCDPLAVAVHARPELIVTSEMVAAHVELQGSHTRSQSVFLRVGAVKNVRLVQHVDMSAVCKMLEAMFETKVDDAV